MSSPSTIDIDPIRFGVFAEPTPLASGFNSQVYQAGSAVIKVSGECASEFEMRALKGTMKGEHARATRFLEVADTEFHVVPSLSYPGEWRVATFQEYIEGPTIAEYMADPQADQTVLVPFLEACLKMYRQTRVSPDVANIQSGFSVSRNHNVIVRTDEQGNPEPVLVDTCSGKLQRKLGFMWDRGIAWGVGRALQEIREGATPKRSRLTEFFTAIGGRPL